VIETAIVLAQLTVTGTLSCVAWSTEGGKEHCVFYGENMSTVTANQSPPTCEEGWTLVLEPYSLNAVCAKELKPVGR